MAILSDVSLKPQLEVFASDNDPSSKLLLVDLRLMKILFCTGCAQLPLLLMTMRREINNA